MKLDMRSVYVILGVDTTLCGRMPKPPAIGGLLTIKNSTTLTLPINGPGIANIPIAILNQWCIRPRRAAIHYWYLINYDARTCKMICGSVLPTALAW